MIVAYKVSNLDNEGIVILIDDENNETLKNNVYNECMLKYGFEPTEFIKISLDYIKISDLTIKELELILNYIKH